MEQEFSSQDEMHLCVHGYVAFLSPSPVQLGHCVFSLGILELGWEGVTPRGIVWTPHWLCEALRSSCGWWMWGRADVRGITGGIFLHACVHTCSQAGRDGAP